MVDNLRRSLFPPTALAALVAGWLLPFQAAQVWTVFIVAMFALPSLLPWFAGLIPRRPGISKRSHFRDLAKDLVVAIAQVAFQLTFLAHQAYMMTDAIVRTLYRLMISRRRLLEWVTAAQTSRLLRDNLRRFRWQLASSAAFALAIFIVLRAVGSGGDMVALPFLMLWTFSPLVAKWVSYSPPQSGNLPVSDRDARDLRLIARRDWRFFEIYVTAADHMLPPDNFQEEPRARRAANLADEYRALSAFHNLGARFRLDRNARCRRPPRSDDQDHEGHGSLSRPLLQLVRHGGFASASPPLRFDGR